MWKIGLSILFQSTCEQRLETFFLFYTKTFSFSLFIIKSIINVLFVASYNILVYFLFFSLKASISYEKRKSGEDIFLFSWPCKCFSSTKEKVKQMMLLNGTIIHLNHAANVSISLDIVDRIGSLSDHLIPGEKCEPALPAASDLFADRDIHRCV